MSDNPLADWLGAHDDGDGDPAAAPGEHPEEDAPTRWPDWANPAAATPEPRTATWAQPPAEETDGASSRRRLLLLAAALPWAVACALGVAVVTGGPAPATDESAAPAAPAGAQAAAGEPTAAVDPALGAAAALAVRLTVTTAAEEGDPGAERRYVDLAVPEALTFVGDVAVVTVAAVVLEGAGDRWHTSRPARFAVPLQLVDGRAVAVGAPWPLALLTPTADALDWEPADADQDSLTRALSAAGYTDIDAVDVEAPATGAQGDETPLLRAHVQARGPGEPERRAHQLWLRTDPEPAVLGADHPAPERSRP